MYVEYSELSRVIDSNDSKYSNRKYANFYDTYGFLVIRNVLTPQEFAKGVEEYDCEFRRRTGEDTLLRMLRASFSFSRKKKYKLGETLDAIFRKGMQFLPHFAEDSKFFTDLLVSQKMQGIFKYFCGEGWLYLGSDGTRFSTTSFPWHRDWLTKIELMKCNFYFNTIPFLKGRFLLIPGSQHFDGEYFQRIQKSVSWPMQNLRESGMTENNFLPEIVNPRKKRSFFNLFKRKKDAFDVPHVKLKIGNRDLLIFDQRMMHCVESSFPQVARRLLTFLISKNAFDLPPEHATLKQYSREEVMVDLLDLIVNERNHLGCEPWGKYYDSSSLANTNHYIKIDKVGNSEKFNRGAIVLDNGDQFESVIDFEKYATIGQEYRQRYSGAEKSSGNTLAQGFSYQDVHLGINSQNIK
ncbi:MAG: hypothetical protein ACPGN6_06395 [Gammaproteobacteria bacterium]